MFLTQTPIQLEKFLADSDDPACGASVLFTGKVRNHHLGKAVKYLVYSCYENMAEKQFAKICDDLLRHYPVSAVRILHRTGRLEIGDIAVVIEVLAAHRDEAYRASREAIERIKAAVPIWKKEFYEDGTSSWTICEHAGAQHEHHMH